MLVDLLTRRLVENLNRPLLDTKGRGEDWSEDPKELDLEELDSPERDLPEWLISKIERRGQEGKG